MKRLIFPLTIFLGLSVLSCSKESDYKDNRKTQRDSVLEYSFSKAELVFGFASKKQYSYCPVVLLQDSGEKHIFFCGNPTPGIIVDNVFHIIEKADGSRTSEKSVLQPSLDWDSHHTCDPSVIQGEFGFNGKTYKYAMFFLSNPLNFYYNEIGVAFSNDLDAEHWDKFPNQIVYKTWGKPGEFADYSLGGNNKAWGVGQPAAVSLDKKGKVLLTYTVGDSSGTRVEYSIFDFSDMSKFETKKGTKVNDAGCFMVDEQSSDILANCDFAINPETNKIVMTRPVHPFSNKYPAYIASMIEIDYMDLDSFLDGIGKWTSIGRITSDISGFPRNHNAGLMRDNFGHIKDWENPTVYFTVSKETPDVKAEPNSHAEWTYNIYKTTVKKGYRYFNKPIK
jgi:hypothetical protein